MLYATDRTRALRRGKVQVSASLIKRAHRLYGPPGHWAVDFAAPPGYDGGPWSPSAEVAIGFCSGTDARNGAATDPIINKPWPRQEHPVEPMTWLGREVIPSNHGPFPAHDDVLDVRVVAPSAAAAAWREVIVVDEESDEEAAQEPSKDKVSREPPFLSQS